MRYLVRIGFCGYIGAEEEYYVEADNEDDARIEALNEAMDDLSVESIEVDE